MLAGSSEVEWLIPGVIHRGAKGLIVGQPKAGKSMIALDLAIALSTGQSWLGITATRPYRTSVVSREDGPGKTTNRLQQFALGRELNLFNIPLLHVNIFEQKASFSIESDEDLEELCGATKKDTIELCIFDVLNKLHAADENDNTKMTAVMNRFDLIRGRTGADVVVIHHDAKNPGPGAKKPRGANSN